LVAAILADVGEVTDRVTLLGAILHDIVVDTTTTPEEIEHTFGAVVRRVVEEVTDDKRLPKVERKPSQIEHVARLSRAALLARIASMIVSQHTAPGASYR